MKWLCLLAVVCLGTIGGEEITGYPKEWAFVGAIHESPRFGQFVGAIHEPPRFACRVDWRPMTWFEKAKTLANQHALAEFFRQQRYVPPRRSYVLAARVVDGVGQPAFQYLSLRDTGFVYSPRHFWPASTIKIAAVLGALVTLRQHQLDGRAQLAMLDSYGLFYGSVADLYRSITNENYDRLLRIAGLESIHTWPQREAWGLPSLVLQRGYGGGGVRFSPNISFEQAGKSGNIPQRTWNQKHPMCSSNCTTLFEIQEIIRRVVLHFALPKSERFPLFDSDIRRWKQALSQDWKWIKSAVVDVLGNQAVIYNKAGSVPGNHLLDNALIVSDQGRFLLTVASPWPGNQPSVALSLRELNELARQTLLMLLTYHSDAPGLQADVGVLDAQLYLSDATSRRFVIVARTSPSLHVQAWLGGQRLSIRSLSSGVWQMTGQFSQTGVQAIVVRGTYKGVRPVGQSGLYRILGVNMPKIGQTWTCR